MTPCMVYRGPDSWCYCRDPPRRGGGSNTHGEDPLLHLVAFQRGKVGEKSQERAGSVYGDGALEEFVCLGRRVPTFMLWSLCVFVPSFWLIINLCA